MNKETITERENITLKWKKELIKKLRAAAEKQNRSLNNYLETKLEAEHK